MPDQLPINPNLILPVGTHVVMRGELRGADGRLICRQGAAGVIVKSPSDNFHSYRVRFPDGAEAAVRRSQLIIRRQIQQDDLRESAARRGEFDYEPFVIYRCVMGSRAYGLDETGSDTDRRGIYLPPAEQHWSLFGAPEQIEHEESQECYWELQKFIILALKANPNILECLYTPLVELVRPPADELIAMREAFLSRMIYQTYNGYVLSQFKKLEQDLRNTGSLRWKHAMHLIRLLLAGITGLEHGVIPVQVGEHRERLLAIRRGEVAWEDVNVWRIELHRRFDTAFEQTTLPERPDYERANDFLIRARRSMVA